MLIIIAPLYANAAYDQYNSLVVPIQGFEDSQKSKFVVDYAIDNNEEINIIVRDINLSHDEFYRGDISQEKIITTKDLLKQKYCNGNSSSEIYKLYEEGKVIKIGYYDITGNTLFFEIGATPALCKISAGNG